MNIKEIELILSNIKFKYAKTMPNYPHEYSVRNEWKNDKEFVDIVLYIRENGIKEKWFNKEYVYLYLKGYKYWTLGNPVCYNDKTKTIILNRVKING